MKKKTLWKIIFVVSIAVFIVAAAGITVILFSGRLPDGDNTTAAVSTTAGTTSPEDLLPANPIDFAALQAINVDIYAWIKIPNTKVDYPILQSYQEHDNYYINHDLNKNPDKAGSIYTQKKNNLRFTDPNTLIYGHNQANGSMFTTLLNFKDENFFNENRTIYIYTPGHILTYEIFAAYMYDDRHILNSFDFYDDKIFKSYLDACLNPKSMIKNVREGVTLTVKDRIITLSTCPTWYSSEPYRYLVQGVLRTDEQTK